MTYQDQKLRAIGRLSIVATVLTALLLVSLIYPDRTRSLVQHLPLSRHGDDYWVWLSVLAIMTPICWAVGFVLIFTSPQQEVRLVKWANRWRKMSTEFDEIEFDALHPDYGKVAWRYFLNKHKADLEVRFPP
jgi:hypothetical protein